jgi:hypothetical protein
LVKEDLNGLGAALIVTAEEGLEVRPGRRIRVVRKVNISIEGIGLI